MQQKLFDKIKSGGESINLEEITRLKESSPGLPKVFLSELSQFGERNAEFFKQSSLDDPKVCMRCLKAHILTKASELNVPVDSISKILSKLNCETGHGDYYLDALELKEIGDLL